MESLGWRRALRARYTAEELAEELNVSSQPDASSPRLPYLDSLRAWLTVLVVCGTALLLSVPVDPMLRFLLLCPLALIPSFVLPTGSGARRGCGGSPETRERRRDQK